MNLTQLECFFALAERLNFTQTANDLFMAQTTLSRTISSLEEELGVRLFHRSSRTVSLTPAGEAFRQEAAGVLESLRNAEEAAHRAERGYQGEIRLGVLQDYFDPETVRIYRAMGERCPQIRLNMREYNHSRLFTRLDSGAVDAIVTSGVSAEGPGREEYVLFRDRQCVVVPKDSPLAQRESVAVEELAGEKFVIMSREVSQPGHDFLWKTLAEAGVSPTIVGQASHVPSLLMMTACGMGLTFMTESMAHIAQGLVTFVPLENVSPCIHSLVWRGKNENPALPRLLETVKELYPQ